MCVPTTFVTDCLNLEIKHKSACNFHITQGMDAKFNMIIVRDLLHMFHSNVAIQGKNLNVLLSCVNLFYGMSHDSDARRFD